MPPVSPDDLWKLPPAAKVYEAFSAVTDGRVHLGEPGQAEVVSSGVTGATRWSGPTTSPPSAPTTTPRTGRATSVTPRWRRCSRRALHADAAVVALFAGVPWHDLNARFKRDYEAAVDSMLTELERAGADRAAIAAEVAGVLGQLAALGLPERPAGAVRRAS